MTPRAQRIAMAGLEGHFDVDFPFGWIMDGAAPAMVELPNYLGDLNAVHRVEEKLSDTQDNDEWSKYCTILNGLCCTVPCGGHNKLCGYAIHATAAQRTEAILRTKGKWDDSK